MKLSFVGKIVASIFGAIIFIIVLMAGIPVYKVWQQGLAGEAELKRAEQSRQIAIEEAKAEEEAAVFKARADSIRAVGVANANAIINKTLTDKFIQWKWVEGLTDGSSEVIYVPTEANIPITAASRFKKTVK